MDERVSQSGEPTARRRPRSPRNLLRILVWLGPAILVLASLIPDDMQIRPGLDKRLEHLIAYFGVALGFALAFPKLWQQALTVMALVACAGAMEYFQQFADGRTPSRLDFFAGSAGAAAGVLLAMVLLAAWSRLRA